MTVLYCDSSALVKRVLREAGSDDVAGLLRDRHDAGDLLASSELAWLEVWRTLRRAAANDVGRAVDVALSGIAAVPLDSVVLSRARAVGGDALRSLDAIHLASAVAVGAEELLTYDDHLASAAASVGMPVLAP